MSRDKVDKFLKDAADLNPAKTQRAQQRYTEFRGRRAGEIELWHQWNTNGRQPEHMEPLLKSMEPLIRSEASRRMVGLGGAVSPNALKQELRNAAARAIETYDPTKGTQLSTHVVGNFRRATGFIDAVRNPKYMVKKDVERFGAFRNAVMEFKEEHGREPEVHELQQKLPWSPKTIKRLQKGFGPEAYTDFGAELEHDIQSETPAQQVRNAVLLMRPTMTQEQQQFADLHYPPEDERQMSVAAIARKLGIPEHKAYRIKKQVEAKLAPVIKGK